MTGDRTEQWLFWLMWMPGLFWLFPVWVLREPRRCDVVPDWVTDLHTAYSAIPMVIAITTVCCLIQ